MSEGDSVVVVISTSSYVGWLLGMTCLMCEKVSEDYMGLFRR